MICDFQAKSGADRVSNSNFKLEENCDFSSNSNVWTGFYELFVGHFKFCWVIFIMTDYWNFVHVFFRSHFELKF